MFVYVVWINLTSPTQHVRYTDKCKQGKHFDLVTYTIAPQHANSYLRNIFGGGEDYVASCRPNEVTKNTRPKQVCNIM